MGLARESVKTYIEYAAQKIADIYENWSVRGEGYSFAEVITLEEAEEIA